MRQIVHDDRHSSVGITAETMNIEKTMSGKCIPIWPLGFTNQSCKNRYK